MIQGAGGGRDGGRHINNALRQDAPAGAVSHGCDLLDCAPVADRNVARENLGGGGSRSWA
jgi:hypothetical protein